MAPSTPTPSSVTVAREPRDESLRLPATLGGLLALPLVILLGIGVLLPLGTLIWDTTGGGVPPQPQKLYGSILNDPLFQLIALRTFRIAALSTLLALTIGYAAALAMWQSGGLTRTLLTAVMLVPLFTSIVVRTYAWIALLDRNGALNSLLAALGLVHSPLQILYTEPAVLVGMVQVLLPYTTLPIFNSLVRIDPGLLRASAVAGAGRIATFRRIVMPLSAPGVATAAVLVFVISLGFYVTPAILGGPRGLMLSNLIAIQTTEFLDLSTGAAMSIVLLGATLFIIAGADRLIGFRRQIRRQLS